MVWLTSQSVWVLVVGCVGIAVLIAVASRVALRAFIPASERDSAFTVAGAIMTAIAAVFAVMTALTVANAATYLVSAQTIVNSEAADASRLAWAATSAGVDSASIHAALLAYLQSTRAHEWHGANAANGTDPATEAAIAKLEASVRSQASRASLGTPTSTELLSSLDAITSDRRARLAAASHELPGLYVITLAASGIALIVNANVIALRGARRSAILVGGLPVIVGLSLALLFSIASPFRGSIVISPQPIDTVIQNLQSGYFHL
jgi:Protein of unknown function (DUF4239)